MDEGGGGVCKGAGEKEKRRGAIKWILIRIGRAGVLVGVGYEVSDKEKKRKQKQISGVWQSFLSTNHK